ncbi:MAG: GNAT family N-acetyltransferase [Candidatus Cloacimonetes bacterium]|nr:GNAT family N-acetyltransferase [Candidatus Cloacimonadota bacterium]
MGHSLAREYFDISGAYGYNGPLGVAQDPDFIQAFNSKLKEYLQDSFVVTEFVRYCPIIENRHLHSYTEQINVLDNVYIDIAPGLNKVWDDSFASRVRKTVRKGESYGLRTQFLRGSELSDTNLQVFFEIYNSTMQRNEADEFYYFDFQFFKRLRDKLSEMQLLSITYYEDIPISTELILLGGELAFGFLGGTLSEYYRYKANTYQRWELLKHLEPLGFKKYSMGGGAARGDSIYDFKMSFSQGCENPFFIGTKVHLPDVYASIISQWENKYPSAAAKHSSKLQGYRYTT